MSTRFPQGVMSGLSVPLGLGPIYQNCLSTVSICLKREKFPFSLGLTFRLSAPILAHQFWFGLSILWPVQICYYSMLQRAFSISVNRRMMKWWRKTINLYSHFIVTKFPPCPYLLTSICENLYFHTTTTKSLSIWIQIWSIYSFTRWRSRSESKFDYMTRQMLFEEVTLSFQPHPMNLFGYNVWMYRFFTDRYDQISLCVIETKGHDFCWLTGREGHDHIYPCQRAYLFSAPKTEHSLLLTGYRKHFYQQF